MNWWGLWTTTSLKLIHFPTDPLPSLNMFKVFPWATEAIYPISIMSNIVLFFVFVSESCRPKSVLAQIIIKQGLVNVLILNITQILGCYHLQQILVQVMFEIPNYWDIYQTLYNPTHRDKFSSTEPSCVAVARPLSVTRRKSHKSCWSWVEMGWDESVEKHGALTFRMNTIRSQFDRLYFH